MSDSDESTPAPRKPQPKPRPRRMGKARSDSVGSPTGAAAATTTTVSSPTSPPQARRRIEDDFFSKAKNYRDVFKVQETTFLTESKPEMAEEPALEPDPLVDDDEEIPVFDFEDEAKTEKTSLPTAVEAEPKRKREVSLTPPPELPTRQYIRTPLIPMRAQPAATQVIDLEDDNGSTEELDPELASIAAKLTSTSSQLTSPPLSQQNFPLQSSAPSSQDHRVNSQNTPPIPTESSFTSSSGSGGLGGSMSCLRPDGSSISSPTSSMTSPPLQSELSSSTQAPVTNIIFKTKGPPVSPGAPLEELAAMMAFEQDLKVQVRADWPFRQIMDFYCTQKRVPLSQLVFTFRRSRLMQSSTPQILMFPTFAVIEVYELSAYKYYKEQDLKKLEELDRKAHEELALLQDSPSASTGAGAEGAAASQDEHEVVEYLLIKLRGQDTADEKIRVKKSTTVQAIMTHYKSIKQIPSSTPIKLLFDDEVLDPSTAIGDADIEDEDMLFVRIG
ncbi:Protein esc2 [Mortierella claussenii]|nr:Protein esc2 [Mortierella claussenii]